MNTPAWLVLFVGVVSVLGSASSSTSQETPAKSNPNPNAHSMTRFLDENTYGFARISVSNLNLDSIYEIFKPHIQNDPATLRKVTQIRLSATQTQAGLKERGVESIYLFASFDDYYLGPVSFAILPSRDQPENVAALLAPVVAQFWPDYQCEVLKEGVFVGHPDVLERLNTNRLKVRDDAQQLFDLAEKNPSNRLPNGKFSIEDLNIVYALTAVQRRIMRELYLNAGPPFETITGPMLADGIQSIRIHGKTDPLYLQAHFQGLKSFKLGEEARAQANTMIGKRLNEVLGSISRNEFKPWGNLPLDVGKSLRDIRFTNTIGSGSFDFLLDQRAANEIAAAAIPYLIEKTKFTHQDNMKLAARKIMLAMHNWESTFNKFPSDLQSESGTPLLSWRVQILPFLDSQLYQKFNRDEPWDSPHNKSLISQMPDAFKTYDIPNQQFKTIWTLPQGEQYFNGGDGFERFVGKANPIALIGVAPEHAMTWTQPTDWNPNPNDFRDGLFSGNQKILYYAKVNGLAGSLADDKATSEMIELMLMVTPHKSDSK